MTQLFPSILITLDLAAGIVYLYYGNWRLFIYWTAAAILTLSITI